MKKLLLISMFAGMLPLSLVAQDDDLYFVPKKKSVERVTETDKYGMPKDVYYSGSSRSIDEYNRRVTSYYEPIVSDSTVSDTISFSAEVGVYPNDSISGEDYQLTRDMSRFDDYQLSDNAAFWAGYEAGRYDWAWHSPWYYSRYGWYDPWYYGLYGWYSPWYYSRYGWYDPWYSSWYSPWYSYWYNPWRYDAWYYGPYYTVYGSGLGHQHYASTIGAGTIRSDGSSYGRYHRVPSARNSGRMSELRNRTVSGNSRNGRTGRTSSRTYSDNSRYNSGNYSNSGNSGSYSSSRSSSGSYSSSRSSSGGGSFSGGGGSRSSGGSGGGSRMGGRR